MVVLILSCGFDKFDLDLYFDSGAFEVVLKSSGLDLELYHEIECLNA